MADDFFKLVSTANPAASQYQQTVNPSYPPRGNSSRSQDLMDPFFDDDDDDTPMPDSAFGRPAPMQSQESGLPLARSAAPPAGTGPSQTSLAGTGTPQGWAFDDDDEFNQASRGQAPFEGSGTFNGTSRGGSQPSKKSPRKKWKWPWEKEVQLTGERVIALNNPDANNEYSSNYVSTSKYNLVSFLPKFLLGA